MPSKGAFRHSKSLFKILSEGRGSKEKGVGGRGVWESGKRVRFFINPESGERGGFVFKGPGGAGVAFLPLCLRRAAPTPAVFFSFVIFW